MTMPLLYQLQNADFDSLRAGDFRVAVVDPDESGITADNLATLQEDQGKLIYAYRSIGEAEDYRDYWQDGDWNDNPPDFLLGENPDWEGNYLVKFWDAEWQQVVFDMVDDVLAKGYSGIYLDIVDGYTVDQVRAAYPGTDEELRQEMIDFVISISDYAKQQNPDFAIIPQNAVGLLSNVEGEADTGPNTAYIDAIDGLGVEDLWYDDNRAANWTPYDLELIGLAQDEGKFVLATSYPTQDAKQEAFIQNAIDAGLIPYVGDRDLDSGNADPINNTIEDRMEGGDFNAPWENVPNDPDVPDVRPDLQVEEFAVQYSNLDADEIAGSAYDLLIVEGKPGDAATAELTDAEVAELSAAGKTMIGYVSVGQTDDARPYWDSSWTDDGTDTGSPTGSAPSWLGDQAESWPATLVEFWDPEWQDIVIDQVIDLATRGYDGIFLDNMLSYYEVAAVKGELGTAQSQFYAQEMMKFVELIADVAREINPDFVVIPNGAPYIGGDAGYALDSAEAQGYFDAIDAVMAESFFGLLTGNYDAGTLDVFQQIYAANGIDVLALEYSTDPEAIAAFAEEAEERGFAVSTSPDQDLDELPVPVSEIIETEEPDEPEPEEPNIIDGTNGRDELWGTDGADVINGNDRADILAGGDGDDHLNGGRGGDELFGEAGEDVLDGGNGHDYMEGGDGDDILIGGRGDDELVGGAGSDTFVFAPRSGYDVIEDFDVTEDVLNFTGNDNFDAYEDNGTLVIDFGNGSEVELSGLTLDDLSEVNITFGDLA